MGADAKELGLVDELGGKDEVINYVKNKIGGEVAFAKYGKKKGFLSSLSEIMSQNSFYAGKGFGSAFVNKASTPIVVSINT